ncbi:MAG: inositol monophosphatase [Actinomycetia bacterium]|nr:inositol monophosphatase [Actinomycetes bacterium]
MSDLDWVALADLATQLAGEAGARALELATSARRSTSTKSSVTDLVTTADTAAEELIVAGLDRARPDDGIEGEEGSSRSGATGVVWHIDPIDGTTNYVYDIPAWSVSIAASIPNPAATESGPRVTVAGVVFDPANQLLFRAIKGSGATRNGDPLSCSTKDELETALVATGFSYRAERRRNQAQVLVEVLPRIRDIRRFGSAALDLCAVATGQVDAYYERGLNRWDLAAGLLVATEAGAVAGNLAGGPADTSFVLASAPGLFGSLQDLLVVSHAI